ncbi:MAG: tetratricopeptide repeat protein [Planctomycetota bacterium]
MRNLLLSALFLFSATTAFAQSELGSDHIAALRDKDPQVRLNTARIMQAFKRMEYVEPLIKALAEEQDEAVRKAMGDALRATTKQNIVEDDAEKWRAWYEENRPRGIPDGARKQLDSYQLFLTLSKVIIVIMIIVVVGVLVAFGAMTSNRMKAMKELTRQAELLIKDGNDVQKKSGSVLEGIDAKKGELTTFFSKLKDENESEIERYGDMIEQNIEHRMREITMTLREKAEKELEQTYNEMKGEIDRRIRTATEEQKDALIRELTLRQQGFLADVESHTLFLEASFFYISGKLPDAIRVYKKLLMLKPTHYIAWNNYGTILRDLMRYEEALEAYQKALDHSPDNAGVLYLFGTVFALQKKKDRMLEYLKKAITFDAEFQDEALNDPCFKEYWEDPEFKDVAEG